MSTDPISAPAPSRIASHPSTRTPEEPSRGGDESERDAGHTGDLRDHVRVGRHRAELCLELASRGLPPRRPAAIATRPVRSASARRPRCGESPNSAHATAQSTSPAAARAPTRCGITDELQLDVFDCVVPGLKHLPFFVHRPPRSCPRSRVGRRSPRPSAPCTPSTRRRLRECHPVPLASDRTCHGTPGVSNSREAVDDQGAHRYRGAGDAAAANAAAVGPPTATAGAASDVTTSAGVGRPVDDDLQQRRDDQSSHELRLAPSRTALDARSSGERSDRVRALRPARRHPLRPDQAGAAACPAARPTARSTGRSARSRRGR